MSETDAAEAKRRAEWLHKHKAHKDWVILSVSEIAVIRAELEATERERDEAREQNAKLREIADAFAVALERLDALYRSEQEPEAPMPRPDWLRRPLQMLDAELDKLKEEAK